MNQGFQNETLKPNSIYAQSGSESNKDKIHYLGELRIIGSIMSDNKDIIGYIIMQEKTGKFKGYTVEQTKALLNKFKFVNAELTHNKIINTECSMERLMQFNSRLQPVNNFGLLILGEIHVNGKLEAYRVMDAQGKVVEASEEAILKAHYNGTDILNAKVVTKGNKRYLSAIKNKFTLIDRQSINKVADKQVIGNNNSNRVEEISTDIEKISIQDRWRHNNHLDKLMNKTLYSYFVGYVKQHTNLGTRLKRDFIRNKKDDCNKRYGVNSRKEIKIICKELVPQLLTTDEQKEVFKNFWDNYSYLVKNISEENDYGLNHEFEELWFGLSQLCMLSPKNADRFLKDSKVKYALTHNGEDDMIYGNDLDEFWSNEFLLPEVEVLLKKMREQVRNERKKIEDRKNKRFNTYSFSTAEDAAQLGFAISEKMDGYQYETKTGSKLTLKYIGKYIPEFEVYKPMATCLGDILILANIERIWSLGTDNKISIEEEDVKSELLLGILALYNPTLCKEFINRRKETFDDLADMLPGFDFDNLVDYQLHERLRLYYESGCCVFYNDRMHTFGGSRYWTNTVSFKYYRDNIRNSEILNYRSLKGPNNPIAHDLLYTELAPILNMITSNACTPELIDKYVGRLRAL